jgi:hypothetical protein
MGSLRAALPRRALPDTQLSSAYLSSGISPAVVQYLHSSAKLRGAPVSAITVITAISVVARLHGPGRVDVDGDTHDTRDR